MKWPLLNKMPNVPKDGSPASFAHKRSYYYHPGVDLYCEEGQQIVAIEDGEVVNFEIFTGPNAEPKSPWWNETWSVMIEGASGVIGYCELEPAIMSGMVGIAKGMQLKAGDIIGIVIPVLKKDKGNGVNMLHLELYKPGARTHATWHHDEARPDELLDPTELLRNIK